MVETCIVIYLSELGILRKMIYEHARLQEGILIFVPWANPGSSSGLGLRTELHSLEVLQ